MRVLLCVTVYVRVCACMCAFCVHVIFDSHELASWLSIIIIVIIMSVFLEHLFMLNCADQMQIQKYKTHAYNYKTPKTAGVQTIMLKHPTKQLKKKSTHKTQILYQCTHK